jgi:tetratricopeptide (TPR) repeat protein
MKKVILIVVIVAGSLLLGFCLSKYLELKDRRATSLKLVLLGMFEYEHKNVNKALEYLYSSIYFDEKNAIAHRVLGLILYKKKLYDLALLEFEEYLKNPSQSRFFSPESIPDREIPTTYCYIASSYEELNDKQLSRKYYDRVVDEYPEFSQFLGTYIKVLNDKKEKSEDVIYKLKLFSKFLEGLQSTSRRKENREKL